MQSRQLQIRLELELEDGQLSGTATHADGATRSFSGWLGLVHAIDALVEAEAPQNEIAPHTNGSRPTQGGTR